MIKKDASKKAQPEVEPTEDLAPSNPEEEDVDAQTDEKLGENVATGEEGSTAVHPEVSFRAQEFYRVLELAVADALPDSKTEYKSLKVKSIEKDIPIWEMVEKEISARVVNWPEWFAILNQGFSRPSRTPNPDKPQRTFNRYSSIKKTGVEVPTEFKGFNERFMNSAESITAFTLEQIGKATLYSLQRFENNAAYIEASRALQGVFNMDKLSQKEEGLPLLDSWQISRLAEELVPEILERISEEVEELKNIRFPYDAEKPCFWNLALIIRIQVQLVRTLRDRISRLIAAAETHFQQFFVMEVLRGDILPLVRSALNSPGFLAGIASLEISAEELEARRALQQSQASEQKESIDLQEEVNFEQEEVVQESKEDKKDPEIEEW